MYGTVSFMREISGTSRVGTTTSKRAEGQSRFAGMARFGCPVAVVVGRGAAREAAICEAVVALLNEISYESMTMDAVAARAKASKATIYRRWSNKDDLVIDALNRMFSGREDIVPDSGGLRDDLIARITEQMQDPARHAVNTAAVKALVYAAANDRELAEVIRDSLRDVHLRGWQTLLDRAHLRGEFSNPVDANLVWEVSQAQFCARACVEAGSVDLEYVEHLVDDVLLPVILHAGSRAVVAAPG